MEWSPDFCLSCDRQITEGAYCSQACRLADLEKAGSPDSSSNLSSSASSSSSSNSRFHLPPAVNFAALKSPSSSRGFDLSSQQYYSSTNGSYFASTASSSPPYQRSLTPSSSRTSLSSASSQPQSGTGLSQSAANQLSGYVRSFDQVRDIKRGRLTSY
ncbi:hypothetical protein GQ43DRAFT_373832 [Delitschia confertaspora ATCC 74209]|uniref:Life-span regulatory factor domain-containing protein n=1 Tax=Delitschia confertaspora ATCC 74209 TaxID=1513339 RepID=A0A9P4MUT2_9PLEO|nr:hypothetical protein GQ43DRAFT_373832 [Delitschia confertaspora ATCC 74209]